MNRIALIKAIFEGTNFDTYLEIGCQTGFSFLPLKAKYKTAVDPCFKISWTKKLKWLLRVPQNIRNTYFEETSDDFFEKRTAHLHRHQPWNVILVDGLHTFRASLKDVLHALPYTDKEGLIIMHDCFPPHEAAALPTDHFPTKEEQEAAEGWSDEWCGDVWKTIVYLRRHVPAVEAYVIDTDYGLGIVRIKQPFNADDLQLDEKAFAAIDELLYAEMIKDPKAYLGLKEVGHTHTLIEKIQTL